MLGVAVLLILCTPLLGALIDLADRRRGRVRRDSGAVARERRDLHADLHATQHRGISSPIGDICRDRQRGR